MPSNVQIGPFVLPVALFFLFATLAAASFIGRRTSRRVGVDVKPMLFWSLVVGLGVARLAFALQFSTIYRASPLAVLKNRDSGYELAYHFEGAIAQVILLINHISLIYHQFKHRWLAKDFDGRLTLALCL